MEKIWNLKTKFSTGLKELVNKFSSPKTAFILAGIISTVWFLIRVIPKPQRALYPCMRAAAPIMSSFIIWGLSVLGMLVAFRKAKSNFAKSKFVFSALFAVVFLLSAMFVLSQNGEALYAKFYSGAAAAAGAPAGTGKGIFPGRVTWTYYPDAAKWTGGGNFWASGVNNQSEYNASFTAGINALSGGSSDAASWDLMFKWFNNSHGRAGSGYVAGDKIAIKINQNNTAYSGAGGGGMNANPYACVAIVASLVNAGVPQADIWIGDPSRAVTDNIFNLIHTAYPDVNVVDYFGNNGRKTTGVTTGDYPHYNKISTCFATARYLVSLPILKGHPGQNFSFGAKNFFGVGGISNNYANNPHPASGDFESAYLTHANIGGKVILWCMDASYPSVDLGSTPSTCKGANFIMSLDGCAEESVSLDMWNMYYGKGFAGENYIDIAAAAGAGVHEHWNNSTDKKYTRNLNPTANGIELVYLTKTLGPVVSITTPVNGSTVIKGETIAIAGVAAPEAGSTITKVEVTAGTTPLTVTGTTSWSCSYVASTAGSLTITAKATSSSTKTGTATSTVTVKEPVVLPAKIEAESYTAMYGIQTEPTTDIGGGLNVGYTEVGDYMDYLVSVPSTGTYTIDFRVASGVATGKFELRNAAGTALATVSQTVAGDWQGWSTKTVTANLTAGVQTLKIYYTGAGLNVNWFEVKTSQILTTITVTPATATTTVALTQQFTAVGKDQNGTVMSIAPSWTASGGGTISTSGLYSATTAGGPFTVTASVGTVSGTAQVTVNPQVLTTLELSPATATLTVGQTKQFTVIGKDQNGNVMPIPPLAYWTSTCGTISPTGLYTATTPGTCTICFGPGTISGCATVTVKAASILTTIDVNPLTSKITVGQAQQFTAVGKDQYGDVMTILPTWSATGGGSISTSGLYSATTAGGPFTVSATVGTKAGAAQVTVDPAPVLQIIQAESYAGMLGIQTEATTDVGGGLNVGWIDAGDWMTYTVTIPQTGTYSVNFRIAGWAATGRISLQNAAFTTLTSANAPNGGAGAYQVWSTVAGEGNFNLSAGTQTIRIFATGSPWNLNWFEIKAVEPSVLSTITVSPSTASIVSGSSQQFTAVGKDQYGTVMTIAPTWSANAPNGLFAGTTIGGPYTVTASVGSITGTATITVTNLPTDPYLLSYYQIVDKWTGDYMRPTNGLATSAISQYESATVPTDLSCQWEFKAAPTTGYYHILNRATGNAIQPTGASVADNAGISQVALNTANQNNTELQWVLQASDEAPYVWIKNRKSGMYIRPTAGTNGSGIAIVQNTLVAAYSSFKWNLISKGVKSARELVATDITSVSDAGFIMYPNPVSDILNIVTSANKATVYIYDFSGKMVMNKILLNGDNQIDVSSLNSGMYIINVNGELNKFIVR